MSAENPSHKDAFIRPGPADLEAALGQWGANCGPASLAAAVDLQLADVRTAVADENGIYRGFMSITNMRAALTRLGIQHEPVPAEGPFGRHPVLICVTWDGPWSSVPRAAATQRHWIAQRGPLVYEVAANEWMPISIWEGIVSALYPKRATGHSFTWAAILRTKRIG